MSERIRSRSSLKENKIWGDAKAAAESKKNSPSNNLPSRERRYLVMGGGYRNHQPNAQAKSFNFAREGHPAETYDWLKSLRLLFKLTLTGYGIVIDSLSRAETRFM